MANIILYTLCKVSVIILKSEFSEHMKKIHDVTTHLDILFALHFATKHQKDSIILKHKQNTHITENENVFTCIFCNIDMQGQVFSLNKLYEFNLHLEENHALFNEHRFILAMHVMEDLNKIEEILFFVGNAIKQKGVIKVKNKPIMKKENHQSKKSNLSINDPLSHKSELKGLPNFCGQCQKGFTTSLNLKYHMLGHTGEKPVICLECGARFKISTHLKRHMFTHTKEKPHICKDCGAGYTTVHALKYHLSTHTEEKLFGCIQCEETFASPDYLLAHNKTHTGGIQN